MYTTVQSIARQLKSHAVDALIIPSADAYQGEYTPASEKRLQYVSGFSGSAGTAIILSERMAKKSKSTKSGAFFTDGRYTLQAAKELDKNHWDIFNSAEISLEEWAKKHLPAESKIGFDPWLHTHHWVKKTRAALATINLVVLAGNPVDAVWKDRPPLPQSPARIHDLKYAGVSSADKIKRMTAMLADHAADTLVITLPESLCWLLNIRGNDVPYTPFVLSYALLHRNGNIDWIVDSKKVTPAVVKHLGQNVKLHDPSTLPRLLHALGRSKKRVWVDSSSAAEWFFSTLSDAGAVLINQPDPILLAKAQKNATEIRGMRAAHTRDGLAVCKLLCWLEATLAKNRRITEMEVTEKLLAFRAASPLFREPSFDTIAGTGAHGAIVHYRATEKTDRPLSKKDGFFLLDSGGQYPDGTTDITRTLPIGTLTAEQKDHYTRVLKGHIALATTLFPEGTAGSQLDALARHALWQAGLDYDHGTGHGVGSYLSVHEGPQRISKRGGDTALLSGMVISNEPGFYKNGAYGIRIENLVLVIEKKKTGKKRFLGFETLTLAPIDTRAIDVTLLTKAEKHWLNQYHASVLRTHLPKLTAHEQQWLKTRCKPI